MNFDEAFAKLLEYEGDYNNDPADPGGETRYGVTIKVARSRGYSGPMKDLPLAFAQQTYREQYWTPMRIDDLPDEVKYPAFDAAVNSGVGQASKWLQRAVGVDPDGVVGPKTLVAVKAMDGCRVAARLLGQRLTFMAGLTQQWPAFGRGWARRIADQAMGV